MLFIYVFIYILFVSHPRLQTKYGQPFLVLLVDKSVPCIEVLSALMKTSASEETSFLP